MKKTISILAVFLITYVIDAAFAQVSLNQELPEMPVFACANLNSAKQQAQASWNFGNGPFDKSKSDSIQQQGCTYTFGKVTLNRPVDKTIISPFNTWVAGYDPASRSIMTVNHNGSTLRIPNSPQRQQVTYYYANIKLPDGKVFRDILVEVPANPAVIAFIDDQKKNPRLAEQQTRPIKRASFGPDGIVVPPTTSNPTQPAIERRPVVPVETDGTEAI